MEVDVDPMGSDRLTREYSVGIDGMWDLFRFYGVRSTRRTSTKSHECGEVHLSQATEHCRKKATHQVPEICHTTKSNLLNGLLISSVRLPA